MNPLGLQIPTASTSRRLCFSSLLLALACLFLPAAASAQSSDAQTFSGTSARLVEPIDEHILQTLKDNVRADVAHAPDFGAVEDTLPLHLFLLLQRTPAQQADLDNLIERQQERGAPEYHKWLTPAQFGARFGASPQDIAKLSAWLQSHGFEVRSVLNNASMIDFAGTAGQVRQAFHTQLHYVGVQGGKYPALIRDPQIPAALAPVVAGIKGLNRIPPLPSHTAPRQASWDADKHLWHKVNPGPADAASPAFSVGGDEYLVSPQDLYTIYQVNPVFTGGNLAATATVAVVEQSDIEFGTVNPTTGVATGGDVATFRTLFGVKGTLNMHVYHGYGSVTCNAPGIDPDGTGEDIEASLDAEWANSTAPSANLIFMSCDQTPDNGIFSSLPALIDNNLADVMSISYGSSELNYTSSSDYNFQDGLYSQAATQGQSIFVSAGDSGSDVEDQNTTGSATSGINVSALGSPLVTVAGGTDFQDLYDSLEGGPAQSTYWSATNSSFYGSAISYVPETSWNASCASSILAVYYSETGAGLCATGNFTDGYVVGGSGGISTHYAAPSWQTGISGYSNAFRSQPDISGFASSGFWDRALIFCDSNPTYTGDYSCTSSSTFGTAGGTSFVAPYLAGAFGLLRTATGSRQGVLNPALYALGKAQYTASATKTACYANGQTSNTGVTTGLPAAACIFNDVTTSNNDVPCAAGATSCYVNPSEGFGMLSLTGATSLTVAYPSTIGFDQVTGIGSVNVSNLINNWNTAFTSSTSLTANPTSINSSQSTELGATVTGGSPTGYVDTPPAVTGTVTFKAGSTVVGSCVLSGGTCSTSVPASSLQSGANSMTATFGGSGTYPSSTSSIVTVTVTGTTLITPTVTVSPAESSITTLQADSVTVTVSGGGGNPTPTGSVALSSGGYNSGPTTLTGGSTVINVPAGSLAVGDDTLTAVYTPDSGSSSTYNSASGLASVDVSQGIGSCTTANPNPNPNPDSFDTVGDFNGNCVSDILWRNSTTGAVKIWFMNGITVASQGIVGTVAPPWNIVGVADFNGDGKADLLWQNSSTGEVEIWLMNGATKTSSGSPGTVGSPWAIAGVGDFNGDGKADILWRNSTTGAVKIWFMNGITVASQGIVGTVAPPWNIVGVGDFNGDGKADLLWQNSSTGEVEIWLMNGATKTSSGSPGTVGSPWAIAGVGDFNGDGKSDMLWRNSTTGAVKIWFMNGTAMASQGIVGTVAPPWNIVGSADFNGDGKADLLWQNTSTGEVEIWLMNGATKTSSGSPGTVTSPWEIVPAAP
jgi:Pro-kumamolisin, activation domain/Bacterial Ig-like domain (group 3)/FG-GAP-like repeat